MPKPFAGVAGNGLHLHHSLLKDGQNVFANATDDEPLGNEAMRHWVAGLATHAAQISEMNNKMIFAGITAFRSV